MESKRIIVCAAATAVSALALAQAGGPAAGGAPAAGARERSDIVVSQPGPQGTVQTAPGLQGSASADREVPWDVRPPQQKNTVGGTPATQPGRVTLPPPGTVTGQPVPNLDTSMGTGGVTSSSAATAGNTSANTNAAAPSGGVVPIRPQQGGAAIITAPSGVLQQQNQVKGGFGSNDPNINATAGVPVNPGLDASTVDVTQRTQQLSQQTLSGAQPAGSTLAPSTQPTTKPVQQRIDIPMPAAPGQTGGGPTGGFGGSTGGTGTR